MGGICGLSYITSTPVSTQQGIKLHKAEKAWKPPRDQSQTQKLYRQVTGILNKLTPQKFNTLVQQMTGLIIDTEERLKGVTGLIYEQAVSEPRYCKAYANACKYMMKFRVQKEDIPGEFVRFRNLLLNQCQREFEKDYQQEIGYNSRMEDIQKAEASLQPQMLKELEMSSTKARRRYLCNIRFIGELFMLAMLPENIMHHCVLKLLKSYDERNLVCLCRLLFTIGKKLDTEEAKPRVDRYFKRLAKIDEGRKASSKVRFLIQDILELRQNQWVPGRDENARWVALEKAALDMYHTNTMPWQRGELGEDPYPPCPKENTLLKLEIASKNNNKIGTSVNNRPFPVTEDDSCAQTINHGHLKVTCMPAELLPTSAEIASASAEIAPTPVEIPSTSAEISSTSAEISSTLAEIPATLAEITATSEQSLSTSAKIQSTVETPATSAKITSTSTEILSTSAEISSHSAEIPSTSAEILLTSAETLLTSEIPSPSAEIPSTSADIPSRAADIPSTSAGIPSPSAEIPSPSAEISSCPSIMSIPSVSQIPVNPLFRNIPTELTQQQLYQQQFRVLLLQEQHYELQNQKLILEIQKLKEN